MTQIGITGHQDIPDDVLQFVKTEINRVLAQLDGNITGVSSLAAGADQLFANAVLSLGGCLHAVIPCARYETSFRRDKDRQAFHELLKKATVVETLDHPGPSEEAYWEAGRRIVDLAQVLVAVWDGRKSRGKGGTADVVTYARERDIKTIVVWPSGGTR